MEEPKPPLVVGDGDERDAVRVETWMIGLRILDVVDFTDSDGQRWRQLTLRDGQVVQIRWTGPWLIPGG